jgi:hypothetical protein
LIAGCLLVFPWSLGNTVVARQPATALSRADIAQAIALGETGEPAPYRLRHQGRPDNPVVVAAVYTPFLRLAFQAKAAREQGRRLEAADIDALRARRPFAICKQAAGREAYRVGVIRADEIDKWR